MAHYDIKSFTYKIKKGSSQTKSSYAGSVGFKRPQSEYEAKKMCEEWLKKKYPGWEISELDIKFK